MRNVHQISAQRAAKFLRDETEGRFFSVYFRKQNGSMRTMTARRGVTQHLAGGSLPYDAEARNLLPVFDVNIRDYRMVNLETLVSFNIGGETFILA